MLTSLPFVDRKRLVEVLESSGRTASSLVTLRKYGCLSDGIGLTPRGNSGRANGKAQLYCALNEDAIRWWMRGDIERAKQVATRAGEVEERARERLTSRADMISKGQDGSIVLHEFKLGATDLRSYQSWGRLVATYRQQLGGSFERAFRGRVIVVSPTVVVVESEDGYVTSLPRELVALQGLDRPGEAVEIVTVMSSPSSQTTFARRALNLDDSESSEPQPGPFAPRTTTPSRAQRLAELLAEDAAGGVSMVPVSFRP